jgi:hypothetical protein
MKKVALKLQLCFFKLAKCKLSSILTSMQNIHSLQQDTKNTKIMKNKNDSISEA